MSQDNWRLILGSLPAGKRRLLLSFAALALIGLVGLLWQANTVWSVEMPVPGGQLVEGIIGAPRFINPLLATSDSDRDLSALIYSGLLRVGADGQLQTDLAADYQVSPDGLSYTFILKNGLTWHDGEPLSTADIAFTVQAAQDPLLKSPKRASWEGVTVETVDAQTIRFTLRQPYSGFLENNATLGILPKHIWSQLELETFPLTQFNTESVGSGPFQVKRIEKNKLGVPEYYDLIPFDGFALGRAKIKNLRVRFYHNEEELIAAFRQGEVESLAAAGATTVKLLADEGARVLTLPLPRVFGVFFNQNRALVFTYQEVRQALDLALDKEDIIDRVLKGYGVIATGPLPPNSLGFKQTPTVSAPVTDRPAAARQLLEAKGWQWNETEKYLEKKTKTGTVALSFSLATAETPELKQTAELLREAWEKIGARVELKIFEIGDLNQNVIRPRQYEALFFGEILNRYPDPFVFWHSSQRLDPGLNIALYANISADKILEEARGADEAKKIELDEQFQAIVAKDHAAVFVYVPHFLYVLPPDLANEVWPPINTPADRFLNSYQWYKQTSRVWKVFQQNES